MFRAQIWPAQARVPPSPPAPDSELLLPCASSLASLARRPATGAAAADHPGHAAASMPFLSLIFLSLLSRSSAPAPWMSSPRALLGGSNAATGPPPARSGAYLPDPRSLHLLYPIRRRRTRHDLHHGVPIARPLPPRPVLEGDAPPAHPGQGPPPAGRCCTRRRPHPPLCTALHLN
ncbi:hypothetical protein VPH35_053844 [Triticum aestivum]